MALSSEIISQFVKSATPKKTDSKESVAYGTIRISDGKKYVRLDGSDIDTPITQAVAVSENDRVVVQIKNHTAYVTGNLTAPSPSATLAGLKVDQLDQLFVSYMHANYADINLANIEEARIGDAYIDCLNAYYASIGKAQIDVAEVTKLKVGEALVERLNTDYADITLANINTANISKTFTDYLSAHYADIELANIDEADIGKAYIDCLNAYYASIGKTEIEVADITKLNVGEALITRLGADYAEIDFANIGDAAISRIFSDFGMIRDLVIVDGNITGSLNADLIHASTITADKLVIKGADGLYYQLNTDGEKVTSQQTDYNSLDGGVITAKSVTADKIYATDLYSFEATIGGFGIDEHALHSNAKASIDDINPGIFMDDSGQINIGDDNDYIKYTKVNGADYALEIAAKSLKIITSEGGSVVEKDIANEISALNATKGTVDAMSGFIDINTEAATIELGDKESPFGVRITNSEIDFKIDREDGSTDVPAYIGIDQEDSKSRLYVERATFEEEIAFGNFVWVKHVVNGKVNMGLIRRGGN